MSRRRIRILVACWITLVILIPTTLLVWYLAARWSFGMAMLRCEMIAPYRDSLAMCHEKGLPVPTSLNDLGRVLLDAPPDPEPPYLEYRPAGHLTGGPYLVLIERPPPKWYITDIWVVYAYADGQCHDLPLGGFKQARSQDELKKWIGEDDQLRASAAHRDNTTRPTSSLTQP